MIAEYVYSSQRETSNKGANSVGFLGIHSDLLNSKNVKIAVYMCNNFTGKISSIFNYENSIKQLCN